jgi:predicted transcriptional regulator
MIEHALDLLFSKADTYQGELLNFESPGHFFGQLT